MKKTLPETSQASGLPWLLIAITLLSLWRIWVITHSGITLYSDEAYYWGWSQHLAWGYFSKPPLVAALIAATTSLLGDDLVGVKAGSLIFYPATALLLYGLGRKLYSERIATLAALAFLTLPITSALGLFISTDAPLLFFWTASLWLLHEAMERDRLALWLGLGLACGLGLMSKYTMGAFVLTALPLLLATPATRRLLRRPGPWLAALVALLVLAPNLWWNWQNDFPTFRHTADIARVDGAREHSSNLLEFLGAQIGSIGPLLAIGFIGALTGLRAALCRPAERLLLAGSLPLLILVCVQALFGHANANWAGPIFCSGSLLAVAWLSGGNSRWRPRLLIAALILNFAITALVYHWPAVLHAVGRPLSAKLDPLKRMKDWDRLVESLAPFIVANPELTVVADDRTLLAHIAYTLRAKSVRVASWNPDHTVIDQYQLCCSLPDQKGLSVLYVAEGRPSAAIARFESSQQLGYASARSHPDFSRQAQIWLLTGFKGYR